MHQKNIEEWKNFDLERLKKNMRCDYKSSALYGCGKNISRLTTKEKYQLIVTVFKNFYKSGYSKYGDLFTNLYMETFKNEIGEIGKERVEKYLLRYIMKN